MAAGQKCVAEILFQRFDPGAYRRLSDVQVPGSTIEVSGIGDFQECPNVIEVHDPSPSLTRRSRI
jgi:hypothetical protein